MCASRYTFVGILMKWTQYRVNIKSGKYKNNQSRCVQRVIKCLEPKQGCRKKNVWQELSEFWYFFYFLYYEYFFFNLFDLFAFIHYYYFLFYFNLKHYSFIYTYTFKFTSIQNLFEIKYFEIRRFLPPKCLKCARLMLSSRLPSRPSWAPEQCQIYIWVHKKSITSIYKHMYV